MEIALKAFLPAIDRSWRSFRSTCHNPECHNTQLMRAIPGGRSGIQAGARWYCTIDCLVRGSQPLLGRFSRIRTTEEQRDPRMSLGLILVSRGRLSADQLRLAQRQSEERHESLEQALLRLSLVSQRQLTEARAAQWGYPALAIDRIGQRVEVNLPVQMLEEFSAAPVEVSLKANRIVIGFAFRVEHSLLDCVEKITQCRAVPCFISPDDVSLQLKQLSTERNYRSLILEDPSQEEMMRAIGRSAVEVGATEVSFEHCRNLQLCRITGRKGTLDVLFRFNELFNGHDVQPAPCSSSWASIDA